MMEDRVWIPTDGDREWPFYRDGMTEREFNEEYLDLSENITDWQSGQYIPLWKQRELN